MNWVGGSRSRLVTKNDAKRQKEFFEKGRIQRRLKSMGIDMPTSPKGTSSCNIDLLTLFIVNRIATKKENKDPPKVSVFDGFKEGSRRKRNGPFSLPMSPCSPSQLSLVESKHEQSVQETRKRKNVLQGYKYPQLSPAPESTFSDYRAPDYLPTTFNPFSPCSSSPTPSGQGVFPVQLNLQQRSQTQTQAQQYPQCSHPYWETGPKQAKFQPFSQPRGMTGSLPWSSGSHLPIYPNETPTAARALFRSPGPEDTEARNLGRCEAPFLFNQSEDGDPIQDFSFNQSETDHQIEEDFFRDFSVEDGERKASHFGRGKLKIYLKDDTSVKSSMPQTVPNPQCIGVEEDECCQPSLQAALSFVDQAICSDSLDPNLNSQANPEQRQSQPRLLTPTLKPNINVRDDQKVMANAACPFKETRTNSPTMGSLTAQSEWPQMQSLDPCKCKKTSSETRDAGTQTENNPKAETCDVSTQCRLILDATTNATGLNLYPPVDVSVQHPATGRQTDTAAEPNTHTHSRRKGESRGKYMLLSKKTSRAGSGSLSRVRNKFITNNSDSKVILPRPVNPLVDAISVTGVRVMKEK